MESKFIEEDGKLIGIGIGTAIHSDRRDLAEALEVAAATVLEQCRREGILWTQPEEVLRRKLEAFDKVREAFDA